MPRQKKNHVKLDIAQTNSYFRTFRKLTFTTAWKTVLSWKEIILRNKNESTKNNVLFLYASTCWKNLCLQHLPIDCKSLRTNFITHFFDTMGNFRDTSISSDKISHLIYIFQLRKIQTIITFILYKIRLDVYCK